MSSPVLLFDLDGTLTDPKPGIVGCIKYALDQLARPCPPDAALAAFIGPPLRGTFATLLESSDKALIEAAMTLYRERFADTGLFENQVYQGIPLMLAETGRRASAAFVATAKPTVYAERIVRHFGLDQHFTGIYGAELDGRFDNKADLLAHVLMAEKIPAATAVMIGDRAVDIIAARANGARSIGVLWGYGSEAELVDAGADILCAAPSELASCLAQITT